MVIIKSPRLVVTESSGNYFQIKLIRPSTVERTGKTCMTTAYKQEKSYGEVNESPEGVGRQDNSRIRRTGRYRSGQLFS